MTESARPSMRLSVLLFGPYQDAMGGARAVSVEVSGTSTATAILQALAQQHAELAPMMPHARLAINGSFAAAGAVAGATDELAIIGLVSGG